MAWTAPDDGKRSAVGRAAGERGGGRGTVPGLDDLGARRRAAPRRSGFGAVWVRGRTNRCPPSGSAAGRIPASRASPPSASMRRASTTAAASASTTPATGTTCRSRITADPSGGDDGRAQVRSGRRHRRRAPRPAPGSRRAACARNARSARTAISVGGSETARGDPARQRGRRRASRSASAPCATAGTNTSGGNGTVYVAASPRRSRPAHGQHDRVVVAVAQLAQPRVDVAADVGEVEVGAQRGELRAAARARRADARAPRQRLERRDSARCRTRRADRRGARSRPASCRSASVLGRSLHECTA